MDWERTLDAESSKIKDMCTLADIDFDFDEETGGSYIVDEYILKVGTWFGIHTISSLESLGWLKIICKNLALGSL